MIHKTGVFGSYERIDQVRGNLCDVDGCPVLEKVFAQRLAILADKLRCQFALRVFERFQVRHVAEQPQKVKANGNNVEYDQTQSQANKPPETDNGTPILSGLQFNHRCGVIGYWKRQIYNFNLLSFAH
ncbi:hypothetical protein D3C86_1752020 [compost metagenome]